MNIHIYTDLYTYGTPKKKSGSIYTYICIYSYMPYILYIYIYPKKISDVKDLKS